jgi:hypothetical protein
LEKLHTQHHSITMHHSQHHHHITSLLHQIQKTDVQLPLPDNPDPYVLDAVDALLSLPNAAQRGPVLGLPDDRPVQRVPGQRRGHQELLQVHQHRPDVQFRRTQHQRHQTVQHHEEQLQVAHCRVLEQNH